MANDSRHSTWRGRHIIWRGRHIIWRGRHIIWGMTNDSRHSTWRGRHIIWVTTLWGIVDDRRHVGFWGTVLSCGTGRAVCLDIRGWCTVEQLDILKSQLATRFTTCCTTYYFWNTYIYYYIVQCRNDTQGRWIVRLVHILESQLAPRCTISYLTCIYIFRFTVCTFFAFLYMHFLLYYTCSLLHMQFSLYNILQCGSTPEDDGPLNWNTFSNVSLLLALLHIIIDIHIYTTRLVHIIIDICIHYYTVQCGKVSTNETRYRVAKTHRMPYLWRSFSAEEPYN